MPRNDQSACAEARTLRAVSVRLLPLLFVLYIFNVLDRTNVAIAALQMNHELSFSPAAFGIGAGIFFLGYSLFEVPSNLILARVGARRWIASIMITWGMLASAMMFVHTTTQFYVLRFFIGVAEAGFFPGVIFYLGQWFPAAQRATATSRFMIAIPLAAAFGGPLGGALLGLRGLWHLSGWQWLFVIEGIPSVILGVVTLTYLQDTPQKARWLSTEQRAWLVDRIRSDSARSVTAHGRPTLQAIAHPLVWILALPYFLALTVWYGYVFWAPLVVSEALHSSNGVTGQIIGAIAALSAVAMLAAGASSDRHSERYLHAAFGIGLAGIGFLGAALIPQPLLRVAALGLVSIGSLGFLVPFWCLPTMLFSGTTAAVGIALVNSIGSIGGFVGPGIIGAMKNGSTGDTRSFTLLGITALIASALCVAARSFAAFRSPFSAAARRSPASEP
ncbi:MAG: major facilitator superfamily 1 [Gammaproteobacteria bacterium]|nr:major facilitator superfamily 1 [Gammaproteobacteria bacterium]